MSYQYVYEPAALDRFKNTILWYKKRSLKAAENFVLEVEERIKAICANPLRYRNPYKYFREAPLKKYPYSIIYFIDEEEKLIIISSIHHHKQHPRKKY